MAAGRVGVVSIGVQLDTRGVERGTQAVKRQLNDMKKAAESAATFASVGGASAGSGGEYKNRAKLFAKSMKMGRLYGRFSAVSELGGVDIATPLIAAAGAVKLFEGAVKTASVVVAAMNNKWDKVVESLESVPLIGRMSVMILDLYDQMSGKAAAEDRAGKIHEGMAQVKKEIELQREVAKAFAAATARREDAQIALEMARGNPRASEMAAELEAERARRETFEAQEELRVKLGRSLNDTEKQLFKDMYAERLRTIALKRAAEVAEEQRAAMIREAQEREREERRRVEEERAAAEERARIAEEEARKVAAAREQSEAIEVEIAALRLRREGRDAEAEALEIAEDIRRRKEEARELGDVSLLRRLDLLGQTLMEQAIGEGLGKSAVTGSADAIDTLYSVIGPTKMKLGEGPSRDVPALVDQTNRLLMDILRALNRGVVGVAA